VCAVAKPGAGWPNVQSCSGSGGDVAQYSMVMYHMSLSPKFCARACLLWHVPTASDFVVR
jgi:hypothetical protein